MGFGALGGYLAAGNKGLTWLSMRVRREPVVTYQINENDTDIDSNETPKLPVFHLTGVCSFYPYLVACSRDARL